MAWQQADKEKIMDQLQAWTVGINDKNTGAKGGLTYLGKEDLHTKVEAKNVYLDIKLPAGSKPTEEFGIWKPVVSGSIKNAQHGVNISFKGQFQCKKDTDGIFMIKCDSFENA
eukprot:TRINITY_DN7648_c0_g2_i1.p2 TRINITY_DN7648_c0_g2~~TRINITY_DN7648_c0_g2_i1.p2  ORF type:complete len:113 (+),score=57.61 TRINITY_DN7648_c0_g2_i1:64-402(+)